VRDDKLRPRTKRDRYRECGNAQFYSTSESEGESVSFNAGVSFKDAIGRRVVRIRIHCVRSDVVERSGEAQVEDTHINDLKVFQIQKLPYRLSPASDPEFVTAWPASRSVARCLKHFSGATDGFCNIGSSMSSASIEGGDALHHLAHGKYDAFLKASFRFRKCPGEHYAAAGCQQVLATVEVVSDRRAQHGRA
jgi:hypothetical protein